MILKAPFPYFGGKSRVAHIVWERFGDVQNYVEPFFGSGAVLLGRPHPAQTETVNDKDAFLVNFWRAIQFDPEVTAKWADWPVSEADLLARHRWLDSTGAKRLELLKCDPEFYDPKVAGWWVWGLCSWIGSGWCRQRRDGDQPEQIPHLGNAGRGINRKLPHLGDAGRGGQIRSYFAALSDRLRDVRIACGEWDRVLSDAVTTRHGLTGIFLDPPYTEGDYDYSAGGTGGPLADSVCQWAVAHGDTDMRIALCGYDGEHSMPNSWECVKWKARKGYQATDEALEDRGRERVWFSPACLNPRENLFSDLDDQIEAIRAAKEDNSLWLTALGEADLQAERHLRGAEEPIL